MTNNAISRRPRHRSERQVFSDLIGPDAEPVARAAGPPRAVSDPDGGDPAAGTEFRWQAAGAEHR